MSADSDAYVWSEADRERYEGRWWAVPRRLVEDGTWARLWRPQSTTRGGGAATSVLFPLTLHAWPKNPSDRWTPWCSVPIRQLAAVSGLHVRTARNGIQQLDDAGLLEQVRERMKRGGFRTRYRLAGRLYADVDGDQAYARLPGQFVYGGSWAMLPTAAARHLFMAIAAMEPIGNEDAYCASVENDHPGGIGPWLDEQTDDELDRGGDVEAARRRWLDRQRARQQPMPLSKLREWTGFDAATLKRTLPILRSPLFDVGKQDIPMVRSGPCENRDDGNWYAPDRRALGYYWIPEFLNDADRVERTRLQVFYPDRPVPAPKPKLKWDRMRHTATWHAWEDGAPDSLCGKAWDRERKTRRTPPGSPERVCRLCRATARRMLATR